MLKLLREHNRFSMDEGGDACYWDVEYAQPTVQTHSSGGEYNFSTPELTVQLSHDWRGYLVPLKMNAKDKEMLKDDVALFNYWKKMLPSSKKALDKNFHGEMYCDASSDTSRMHGLRTFLKFETPVAADRVAVPSNTATYGGKAIKFRNEGGAWSTEQAAADQPNTTLGYDWPEGYGDSEADYISPLGLNSSSTNWGTDSTEFEDNCWRVFEYGTDIQKHRCGEDGGPDIYLCALDRFQKYKRYQETKFRNVIPHETARDLGFGDVLNQDGVMIKSEFDVPAGQCFGLCIDQMEVACLTSELFYAKGPQYDIRADADLLLTGFWGNVRYNPKYFIHVKDFA